MAKKYKGAWGAKPTGKGKTRNRIDKEELLILPELKYNKMNELK